MWTCRNCGKQNEGGRCVKCGAFAPAETNGNPWQTASFDGSGKSATMGSGSGAATPIKKRIGSQEKVRADEGRDFGAAPFTKDTGSATPIKQRIGSQQRVRADEGRGFDAQAQRAYTNYQKPIYTNEESARRFVNGDGTGQNYTGQNENSAGGRPSKPKNKRALGIISAVVAAAAVFVILFFALRSDKTATNADSGYTASVQTHSAGGSTTTVAPMERRTLEPTIAAAVPTAAA
ncbi:MAG: hypothetical protein Q4C01_04350, partial [Clostridia bacterium]|nr:hypothetical protein [Clostridia bacterium]